MPVLAPPPTNACHKHACAIQRCLRDSNYDSRSCKWAVDALIACCKLYGQDSIHCAQISGGGSAGGSGSADGSGGGSTGGGSSGGSAGSAGGSEATEAQPSPPLLH